ncbi:MAG: hypothetical protein BWK76_16725 [Desulfobulbaceae bacterium A2]|nr:MAG: hypothetical protein BWK76_16725 [Desulfobulbaceae bacterium A2]
MMTVPQFRHPLSPLPGALSQHALWTLLLLAAVVPLVLLPVLLPLPKVMPQEFFLPLHTLLEFLAVVVDFLVFTVVWHAGPRERPDNMSWLACGMFAAGWLDFTHALSTQGMPGLFTPAGAEKAIAFWLAARLMTAAGLCLTAFTPHNWLQDQRQRWYLLLTVSLLTIAVHYLLLRHQDVLVRTFIAGQGFTSFKLACEGALIVLFCLAALRFQRWSDRHSPWPLPALAAASAIFALAEFYGTLDHAPGDFYYIVGHVYKISAALLVYQTVFVASVRAPYSELLVRKHELAEANEQLRRIFDTAAVGMSEFDPASGRYLRVNAKFAGMFGYEANELPGTSWHDLSWPADRTQNQLDLQQLLAGERPEMIREKRYRHRLGHEVRTKIHVTLIRDGEGRPLRALNIVTDLSDLQRVEQERRKLERQLFQTQKIEAMGQLIAGIAHDFNNTLTVILGFSGLALNRHHFDAKGKIAYYLRQIHVVGERAQRLVAKLLAYSRHQTLALGEIPPLPCAPAINETLKLLAVTIPATIQLVSRINVVPPCRIDPVDLHQLLMNLVLNARDAVGEGGRIEIELGMMHVEDLDCAICHQVIQGEFIALTVTDNGTGIPEELLPRLFDPFFTTKEHGKGTGLGLSVVQGILRQVGGHVLVESCPAQGTSFLLLLPQAVTGQAQDHMPAASPAWKQRRRHILLVHDGASLCQRLRSMLTGRDYAVTDHQDAGRALNDFCACPDGFDLLLCDQFMPGISGLELTRAARAVRPQLPVIVLCDTPPAAAPEEPGLADILALCRSPINEAELQGAIITLLGDQPAGVPPDGDDTPSMQQPVRDPQHSNSEESS